MSQYPSDPQFNQGYVPNYYTPTENPRPGIVTGLAITGIVLGSLGIICRGCGAISAGFVLGMGANALMPTAPKGNFTTVYMVNLFGAIIDLLFWIAVVVLSVAALNLKPFARGLLMKWSVGMIAWQIIWFVFQLIVVIPATRDMALQMPATQANTRGMAQFAGFMKGAQIGGAVFTLLLMCVLPILFLAMWRTPRVRAAFEGMSPPEQLPPVQ